MPRIVSLVLVVGLLAAVNRLAPELITAVLVLVLIYLVVTHSDQVNRAFLGASASLARGFGTSP
jgi:hypothetical protein